MYLHMVYASIIYVQYIIFYTIRIAMYVCECYIPYAYSVNRRMVATEHRHVIIEASDRTMHDRVVLPDCYILDCDMYCDVLCMLRLKKFE